MIFGQSYPSMEAPAIARVAALDAGLPITAAGYSLDRRCGSGLQAVLNAAMQVQTGVSDVVIAGGVDSMSQAPFYRPTAASIRTASTRCTIRSAAVASRSGGKFHPTPDGTIETAENLRREYGISREDQDAFSLRSHQRAVAAQGSGVFAEEIVAIRGHRPGRASTCRHLPRGTRTAQADPARQGRRVDRDRGQCRGPERRGGRVHRHDARACR